jgi:phenylacetate-CoA ligase
MSTVAAGSPRTYWDQDAETIGCDALQRHQLQHLRATVQRVREHVPFYRERFATAGMSASAISSVADLSRFPFTTADDLRDNYPFGMLAVTQDETIRVHTSSGTTGKPKAVFFSRDDIDRSAGLIARCLTMSGTGRGDVLQNMMTYGLFTGALVMHYGAEKVGSLVIPAGPGNTHRQITLMKDFGTTALHITPSFALYLASVMQERGVDPRRDLRLRRAYLGAEPYSEETRRKIEALFDIDIYNCYGLTEMNGPGVAFECSLKDGMHLWEDHFIMEIIDPESGAVLPDGEKGELVLTSLQRDAMPLIRYRTRDITSVITGPCACGRTHRRITRILGRSDDMFIVKGVNVFPQQIERILMGIKGVAENYLILLEDMDQMTVQVEIARDIFDGSIEQLLTIQSDIIEQIRSDVLVKPKVELLSPGTLPVSEGKAKRVIDKRTL